MSGWDLPTWPEDYATDGDRLGPYQLETRRFLAAVPGIAGPFLGVPDFQRRALTTRERKVRVYRPAGTSAEIVVPEDYAASLDSTRRIRSFLAGDLSEAAAPAAADASIGITVIDDALPEHFVSLLDLLPDNRFVEAVILLDEPNPADAWHRQASGDPSFRSAASAANGLVTFFSPKLRHLLAEEFLHEVAHVFGERLEGEMGWFRIAANLEEGGYIHRDRAGLSLEENWAVHLGECVLGGRSESFQRFCGEAPLRAAVLGMVVSRLLENDQASASRHVALASRGAYLNSALRSHALDSLRAIAKNLERDAGERNRAMRLLLALLRGEPLVGFDDVVSLDLSGAWLGRIHMESLRALTAIEELDLSDTLLGRGGLEFLASFPKLRRLNLRGNELWTSDMYQLRRLPALEWLDVGMTRINSSSIADFARLKTLRTLSVDGTDFGDSAEALHSLLPKCDVQT